MEETSAESQPRRLSRARRVALGTALVLIAILVALWLVRKPIATRFVDRALAAADVPARYAITDLGFGGQRLTGVVIGDPAAPDLVADWIETRTRIGTNGPELSGVRAGRVRVRGRLVDGRLSLGAIDRLLPKPGGGAFKLPRLSLAVEDARMRLETPYGVAGVALSGSGRIDDGFAGRIAVVAERMGRTGCTADRVAAALRVRSQGADGVTLAGPVNVARATCGGARVAALRSDVAAKLVIGRARGTSVAARVVTGTVTQRLARAADVRGTLALVHDGGGAFTLRTDLAGTDLRGFGVRARRVALNGMATRSASGSLGYGGAVVVDDADATTIAPRFAGVAAGSPVAPLVDRLAQALRTASSGVSGRAQITLAANDDDVRVRVPSAVLTSASGARATFMGGTGIAWRSGDALLVDGTLAIAGGGLPSLTARAVQQGAGEPRRILVTMVPYEAGGARLALAPVAITGDAARIVTRATLSGPIGGGRVERLTIPLDLRLARGALVVNPACTPIGFDRLTVLGLTLNPARLTVCPTGDAIVRIDRAITGGARIAATRLAGTLGTTPVALALSGATLRLADRGFAIDAVAVRIGSPARLTRLDFARVEGRVADGGIAGTFTGGAGQIANVPLLLGDAAGDWRFASGALRLTGALGVSDAQLASPRFQPMRARGVALSLVDGTIAAGGVLQEPTTGTMVATVAITHALASGIGRADLAVPGLAFVQGFQPELLTRLTFGVIADVRGTISGDGRIAWSPQAVTSTGTFRTAGTDLAAAFGPVTGIAGTIRFTDLLALESAPDQVATIASVNPGIAVTDGTIRYRTLAGARVRVAGGEWPFAGGRLTLDPTLLDFSKAAQRRMTFRVEGIAADRFLQQFDFKNLDATGTFDGVLPMVFDDAGGRIEGGRMTVREGGGTIRYVGEITKEDVGFWGNLAFQALKSLRYRSLGLTMNGPLAGEMVTDVRFAGVSQGEGAKGNFLIRRLQRLPFVFNVRIKAPFRGLIDSAQSFYEPRRLIQRNLPQLLDEQNKRSVQPPASATPVTKD